MQRVAEGRVIGRAALINTGDEAEAPTSANRRHAFRTSPADGDAHDRAGHHVVHRALVAVRNARARGATSVEWKLRRDVYVVMAVKQPIAGPRGLPRQRERLARRQAFGDDKTG